MMNKKRNPFMETFGQLLVLASLIVAVVYGGGWYPTEGLIPVIVKGSAVGLLAFFVLIRSQTLNHLLLLLALIASVAGDVLLALPLENSFVKGLSAFLIAHLLFVGLYIKNRMDWSDVSKGRKQTVFLLWIVSSASAFFVYPLLGELLIPVLVYTFILTLMASMALFSRYPVFLTGFGAILFLISDAVLGARQFLNVPDYLSYVVWGTYYFAQLFMTLGVMITDERRTHYGGYRFD